MFQTFPNHQAATFWFKYPPNRCCFNPIARLAGPFIAQRKDQVAVDVLEVLLNGTIQNWGWVKTLVPLLNPKIAGLSGCSSH
jgi:hypothetical protein